MFQNRNTADYYNSQSYATFEVLGVPVSASGGDESVKAKVRFPDGVIREAFLHGYKVSEGNMVRATFPEKPQRDLDLDVLQIWRPEEKTPRFSRQFSYN